MKLSLLTSLAPVSIAVFGWIASHLLSLRAQRKGFQNQVLDRARGEITTKLREYQGWLGELTTWIRALGFSKAAMAVGLPADLQAKAYALLALQNRTTETRAWSRALEDYQILFPETALARFRLDRRHLLIVHAIEPVFSDILKLSLGGVRPEDIDALVAQAQTCLEVAGDQAALLEDLRVHLQNITLSKIMNNSIPARNPADPRVPRLRLVRSGALEVIDASGKPLDDDGATPDEIAAKILSNPSAQLLPPN